MSEPLVQRIGRRVDNVTRRIEIGFADLEMDNVAALCLQRFRFDQHFEGGLGAETRHALCEAKFMALSHKSEISIIKAVAQLVFYQVRDRGAHRSREFAADTGVSTVQYFEARF